MNNISAFNVERWGARALTTDVIDLTSPVMSDDESPAVTSHIVKRMENFESLWDSCLMDASKSGDPDLEILKCLINWISSLSDEMQSHYMKRLHTIVKDCGWAFKWFRNNYKLLLVLNDARIKYKFF